MYFFSLLCFVYTNECSISANLQLALFHLTVSWLFFHMDTYNLSHCFKFWIVFNCLIRLVDELLKVDDSIVLNFFFIIKKPTRKGLLKHHKGLDSATALLILLTLFCSKSDWEVKFIGGIWINFFLTDPTSFSTVALRSEERMFCAPHHCGLYAVDVFIV